MFRSLFANRRRSCQRSRPRRAVRRLQFESLGHRKMMAGIVGVEVVDVAADIAADVAPRRDCGGVAGSQHAGNFSSNLTGSTVSMQTGNVIAARQIAKAVAVAAAKKQTTGANAAPAPADPPADPPADGDGTSNGRAAGGAGNYSGGGIATTVQLPTFAFTSVSTTVSVPDGGTVLLGGIKRLAETRQERGVPLLSKIPYVSRLFKNVGIGRDSQTLMLMVTPRIIIQEE